jgi:hypothetical protein
MVETIRVNKTSFLPELELACLDALSPEVVWKNFS